MLDLVLETVYAVLVILPRDGMELLKYSQSRLLFKKKETFVHKKKAPSLGLHHDRKVLNKDM
jgi:hypothetical protein